jgi:DNA-binding NarL/FixJ family response regulator
MTTITSLEKGRNAFREQAWSDAYNYLVSATETNDLNADDLELLAKAAYLTGKSSDCKDFWSEAHHKFLNQENTERAIHSAFWIGLLLFFQGNHAQGSGWLARAARIADDHQKDCAEEGFLLIPQGLQQLRKNDPKSAYKLFQKTAVIGNRFGNIDLMTLGRLGCGQALIAQNKIDEGTALFDEIMVAVVSGEVSPIVAGIVYCAVIETCQKIYDLRRAIEWTDALSRWCESQPDLIPYRGQCLVRRAEIMQLHGEWPDAINEIERACQLAPASSPTATGEAFYRRAELYRLQGRYFKAEKAYRQANECGRNPHPGLALMRLAQGKTDIAKTAILQVEDECQDKLKRSRILPTFVEIMLAANQTKPAEDRLEELIQIAEEVGALYLQALVYRLEGHILLANENPGAALKKLRQSRGVFKEIRASYESAQTQVLIGLACRELGDYDTADMELETAHRTFQQLGATPDKENVESLLKKSSVKESHGLTPRELEILCILATGKTNKNIAEELFISERTVDRHVSNILGKLDVASRVAATAFAYEHDLV